MRLVQYLNSKGEFDYDMYRSVQIAGNRQKLGSTWVNKQAVKFLANYLQAKIGQIEFGLCHGTRRGSEQAWFSEYLEGANVVGTEISDTATQFPNTVQHDFHDVRPEWVGKADFVYSNSWDHSFDPKRAFSVWMESLRPRGLMILEHTIGHGPDNTSKLDPFGISFDELVEFINQCGREKFSVAETLEEFDFEVPQYMRPLKYCVVANK